jgi:tRNA (guanine37-N1)-methyltransferase
MITISIISVFPEIHETFLKLSLIGKAQEKGLLKINLIRFSDFVAVKERIDQALCGPSAGMILKPDVVEKALNHCIETHGDGFKIFFSPQGTILSQPVLKSLAAELFPGNYQETSSVDQAASTHLILICPRYEGMDARVEQTYADAIISIGDYVLMGGDLPAQVLLEGLLRYAPGIVGNAQSVEQDSFSGPLLDHPAYSLPVVWHNQEIPAVVRSGNHEVIRQWQLNESCKKTILKRFDWFRSNNPEQETLALAQKNIPPHYVVLMHDQIKLPNGQIGTTSVTSIDIHDTARSCASYGVNNFFIVTPLVQQLSIVHTFLDFWHSEEGKSYNPSRYQAVSKVQTAPSLTTVLERITAETGKRPLIITTSAKKLPHSQTIDFNDQGIVWEHDRPVVLLFGTGQGLADEVVAMSDYLLIPVQGMTNYNHLSVRSAMAIILDRWLGLQPRNRGHNFGIAKKSK